jgi:hypothetical protein
MRETRKQEQEREERMREREMGGLARVCVCVFREQGSISAMYNACVCVCAWTCARACNGTGYKPTCGCDDTRRRQVEGRVIRYAQGRWLRF